MNRRKRTASGVLAVLLLFTMVATCLTPQCVNADVESTPTETIVGGEQQNPTETAGTENGTEAVVEQTAAEETKTLTTEEPTATEETKTLTAEGQTAAEENKTLTTEEPTAAEGNETEAVVGSTATEETTAGESGDAEQTGTSRYDTAAPEIQAVTFELINGKDATTATTESSVKITVTAIDDTDVYSVNFNVRVTPEDKSYSYYTAGGWYRADNEDSQQGWTVDGHTYTYELSLANMDYDGYVYLSSVWVEDANKNITYYQDDNDKAPVGMDYGFRLLGKDKVPQETYTESKTFSVESAGVYKEDGITPYQMGDVITPGTTVVYRVTTKDTLPVDTIELYLCADLDNVDASEWLYLTRQEDTNIYEAKFTFTADMYPTAWKANHLYYYDQTDQISYYAYSWSNNFPKVAELILKNGDTVVYPTISYLSTTVFSYDDQSLSEGSFGYDYYASKTYKQTVPKFSKLTKVVTLPEAPTYKIDGKSVPSDWYVYEWQYDSETNTSAYVCKGKADDYIITDNDSLTIVAKADGYEVAQIVYPVEYNDFDYMGNAYAYEWVEENADEELVKKITESYKDKCTKGLGDITFYVSGINYDNCIQINYKAEKAYINLYGRCVFESAEGLDWANFLMSSDYYDPATVTVDDLIKKFDDKVSEKVQGAEFKGWAIDEEAIKYELEDVQNNGGIYDFTGAYAQYDKDVVAASYYQKDSNGNWSYLGSNAAFYENGTSKDVILADLQKKTIGGYTNWTLNDTYNDSFATYYTFVTDGTKAAGSSSGSTQTSGSTSTNTGSTQTSTGTTADTSSTTKTEYKAEAAKTDVTTGTDGKIAVNSTVSFDTQSTTTENGKTQLSDTAVTAVTDLIKDTVKEAATQTTNGTVATPTVKVSMADATVIPTDILNAAKGQDVNVEFVMTDDNGQEYSWTINGNSIKDSNLKEVNLKVNKGTSNVPSAIVNSTVGDQPTVQLNLEDHGLFGFTADLRTYVGKEYAGQYANLYYYTNGRLEIQYSCAVDADGYTTLRFTHASDYVIAIGKQAEVPTANTSLSGSPKTGDTNSTGLFVMIFAVGCIAFAGAAVYRRKRA
jgi:LPXTG-motif cell wall-anchored protein